MSLSIIVRDEAEQDILEASRWYEDRAMGLGLEFIRSIDTYLLAADFTRTSTGASRFPGCSDDTAATISLIGDLQSIRRFHFCYCRDAR